MNKITTDIQCNCRISDEPVLRLVAGNDFTMRISMTKTQGDSTVPYDLSNAEDLVVNAVALDGTTIELDSFIEDTSHIIASVDAQQFDMYVKYSIEVIWRDEPYDKRACTSDVFMWVATQQEANQAQNEIVSGPYDYELEIINDIAYVMIGTIPSTEGAVTYAQLEQELSYYATISYVQDAISYVEVDTTYYYTKSEIDTKLNDYGTALNIDGEYIQTDTCISKLISLKNLINGSYNLSSIELTAFKKKINNDNTWSIIPDNQSTGLILKSDVQMIHLDNERISAIENGGYITQSDLTNNSYATQQYVTDAIANIPTPTSEVTYEYLSAQSYVTQTALSNNAYVTQSDLSSNSYATQQYVTDAISQIPSTDLSNYYTKSEIDTTLSSYVTSSDLNTTLGSYVTYTDWDTNNQSVSYDLGYLDDRVTYIEQNGGGGSTSGVSEEDWDNSNEAVAQELVDNRLEHLSINNNFNNYYTKTEADSRYATASWANDKFVTKADDVNRQQAIAAAFGTSVQSTTVHNIWTGSQNDYDAITTKDTNTLYIIL